MAYPGRIQQILTNLAENAVTFTVQRHMLINSDCQQHMPEHAQIRFTIEYTDIDIAEDPPERLFDKFTRVGAGHPETVSRPHGRYYWSPERTRARVGLLFALPLPLHPHGAADVPPAEDLSQFRVLVVQEHLVMRQALQEQLASWHLNHHGCSRATEALTPLQTTQAAGMED